MKKLLFLTVLSSIVTLKLAPIHSAMAKESQMVQAPVQRIAPAMSQEMIITPEQMQFNSLMPGVAQMPLWGNPAKGPHMAVTKFSPGTRHPLHTHSSDIKVVVMKGTFLYQSDGEEKKLGPGTFLLIPAGKPHTSGAEADEEVVFIQQSQKKFDMKMVKQ